MYRKSQRIAILLSRMPLIIWNYFKYKDDIVVCRTGPRVESLMSGKKGPNMTKMLPSYSAIFLVFCRYEY
jgi:hypothetical protein